MFRTAFKLLAGAVIATSAAVSSAAAQSQAPATRSFSVHGSVAGGVKTDTDNLLTFVFTEKNTGSVSGEEFLVLKSVTKASIVAYSCVLPNGHSINSDGDNCEPGFIKPGQVASSVLDLRVTATSGYVSAETCLENGTNGHTGPCKTLSVQIG